MLKMFRYVGNSSLINEKGFIEARLDLNGDGIKKWLESNGIKCIENFDTGRNGLVKTADNYLISRNGYCYKIK